MAMRRPNWHVEESRPDIHLAEPFAAMDLAGEVSEQGEREDIVDSPEVQQTEVRARPDPASGLVGQMES